MDKRISNWDHFTNILKLTILGVIILLTGMVLLGCTPNPSRRASTSEGREYPVTVIDGCEYLLCGTAHGFYVPVHKGNCTNSIHVYRVESK